MNNSKRIWIVALTITGQDDYINSTIEKYLTESDARDALAAFKLRCIKQGDSSVPSYATRVDGAIMKVNPNFVEGADVSINEGVVYKHIPTGGVYHGVMESFDFDPDALQDTIREYQVEVTVIRTSTIEVTVEAESTDDAEEKARERIEDGDEDHQIDCVDDFEIDIVDSYES